MLLLGLVMIEVRSSWAYTVLLFGNLGQCKMKLIVLKKVGSFIRQLYKSWAW